MLSVRVQGSIVPKMEVDTTTSSNGENVGTANSSVLYEQFQTGLKELRATLNSILALKTGGGPGSASAAALQTKSSMQLLHLKQLQRSITAAQEQAKSQIAQKKSGLDAVNLTLQSLLYEKSHLIKEINVCKDFTSSEKEIDLIPVSEFQSQIQLSASDMSDKHKLHLARLMHEQKERKRYLLALEEANLRKKSLQHANSIKLKFLQSLIPKIEQIHKVSGNALTRWEGTGWDEACS